MRGGPGTGTKKKKKKARGKKGEGPCLLWQLMTNKCLDMTGMSTLNT